MNKAAAESVIGRKVASSHSDREENGLQPERALSLALARAADRTMGLLARVQSGGLRQVSATEVIERLPDPALLGVLDGPGGAIGLAVFDAALVGVADRGEDLPVNLKCGLGAQRPGTADQLVQIAAGDPWQDYLGCSYYVCGEQPVAFRNRSNWTLGWNKDDWSASVYGFRNSGRVNYRGNGILPAYVQWNASVSKKITDKVRLGVDVTNLFDKYGPKDPTITWYPFYSMAYGAVGRAVYMNLDIDF